MEHLIKPFYGVMHKYQKHFSERGVRANLSRWQENKAVLLALLRSHPNWDEEALAVVFQITEDRAIDRDLIDDRRNGLLQIARDHGLIDDRLSNFSEALMAATGECRVSPSEPNIEIIKEKGGIPCVTGQKASRIVNKLCQSFGVNNHSSYNQVFAQLSDTLSPIAIRRKALLSLHPCDFLEMSNRDNSWSSCHSLVGGGWQAGCLSYMGDNISMVFYTVDDTVTDSYRLAPKRARQVFCYDNGMLLQSRLYPADNDLNAKELYRHLVQSAIADCLGAENRWIIKKQRDEFLQTAHRALHYLDYTQFGVVCTLKGLMTSEYLLIGSQAPCVCCGAPLQSAGSLKCNCDSLVVCDDCGESVRVINARYHDEKWVCNSCLRVCAHCGHAVRGDLHSVFDGQGGIVLVCGDCREQLFASCAGCSVRAVCGSLIGNRFCQRTAAHAVAA